MSAYQPPAMRHRHRPRSRWSLAALFAISAAAHADGIVFLVGGDAACDYASVQAAINAAAALPGPDAVHFANNVVYDSMALNIGSQDVELVGGFTDCATALTGTPSGHTRLNGAGGAARPVFTITGSGARTLSNLVITGGDASGDGGGINYVGSGSLVLRHLAVETNSAGGQGGGIHVASSGGSALLELQADTRVTANTAQGDGGGISVEGDVTLYMDQGPSTVNLNRSNNGRGGGIAVKTGATAYLGSPGMSDVGALFNNTAVDGGGLAVLGASSVTRVYLYTTDRDRPFRIHDNVSFRGGGIYTQLSGATNVQIKARHFRIDGNRADDGAAFFGHGGPNGFSSFCGAARAQDCVDYYGLPFPALGEACPTLAPCNVIEKNVATAPGGAILTLADERRSLALFSAMLSQNRAFHLLRSAGDRWNISDSVIGYNVMDSSLIDDIGAGDALRSLHRSTLSSNTIGDISMLRFASGNAKIEIKESVIDQPANDLIRYPFTASNRANVRVDYNLLWTQFDPVVVDPTSTRAPPHFVDRGNGDFHLRPGSLGVDYAMPEPGDQYDLDGQVRDQDQLWHVDRYGTRDVGAYELRFLHFPDDYNLPNGTFDRNLIGWTAGHPQTRWSTIDRHGQPNSGSLEINVPSIGEPARVTVATQCIPLPQAGVYELRGWAYSGIQNPALVDQPRIRWLHRPNDTGECAGGDAAASAQGELPFGGGWAERTAAIVVPQQGLTHNSTIEVRLEVVNNTNGGANDRIFSRFDDVSLTLVDDHLFTDGFD